MFQRLRLSKIHNVGLIVKHHQPEAAAFAEEVGRFLVDHGLCVYFEKENADSGKTLQRMTPWVKVAGKKGKMIFLGSKAQIVMICDHIDVLGGDGTFISISRHLSRRSVPILGINMGHLGFLTEIKKEETFDVLSQLLKNRNTWISERTLLDVTMIRKNRKIFNGPVVNDAVISKGAIARIIGLRISLNGQWAYSVRADGLIVSTPTGSTAYALSAGGPIMLPTVPGIILAPICPHSLSQRPIVIPNKSEIQIQLDHRPGPVFLTLDGQDVVEIREGDIVTIRRFTKHNLRMISAPAKDHFEVLREKLLFGVQ